MRKSKFLFFSLLFIYSNEVFAFSTMQQLASTIPGISKYLVGACKLIETCLFFGLVASGGKASWEVWEQNTVVAKMAFKYLLLFAAIITMYVKLPTYFGFNLG